MSDPTNYPADWTTTLEFDDDAQFDTEFDDYIEVVTSDHRDLTHRDAENQHPIGAIENLIPELGVRPSAALSNQDIQDILDM